MLKVPKDLSQFPHQLLKKLWLVKVVMTITAKYDNTAQKIKDFFGRYSGLVKAKTSQAAKTASIIILKKMLF